MNLRIWRRNKSRSKRAEKESRSKRGEENNRMFIKELIKSFDGKCNPIRIFTEKELSKATDNYDPRLLIRSGFFDLYRGVLGATKDCPILVKKLYYVHDEHRESIINEVVVLSQINHKHVVKLLGCCLETEFPILVYESSHVNKILSNVIINDRPSSLFSWESRLRIATEIADAITYIHTFSSRPIIHRNIHLWNIFLDHQDVARLFGFSICIRIPHGQTHVGYREGVNMLFTNNLYEIAGTNEVSEKVDVYSFGVVLFEILSGGFWFNFLTEGFCDFESRMRGLFAQDRHLRQIVDPRIAGVEEQMSDQQLEAYTNLIVRCTYTKEDERPEMIEVAKELRRIWKTTQVQSQ